MLNRAAETLFWLGRYIERVENHARLIDVNYHMRHELKEDDHAAEFLWVRLVEAVGDAELFQDKPAIEQEVLHFMTFEREHGNSIYSCVLKARDNARDTRERLPSEVWDTINSFYLWIKDQGMEQVFVQSPYSFFQKMKEWTATFQGVMDSTMIREKEWHFIQAGKHFERAENTVRILDVIYRSYVQESDWFDESYNFHRRVAVLKSLSAYEAYRRFYPSEMNIENIIRFLLTHPTFPRSIQYSISGIEDNLRAVQAEFPSDKPSSKSLRQINRMKSVLADVEWEELDSAGYSGLLRQLLSASGSLGETIASTFFRMEALRS